MDWQIIIPLSSMIAGLTAMPHCMLMCGPLFTIFNQKFMYYQAGRILGYTSVGTLLGLFSLGVDTTGIFMSVQHLSLYFIGAVFVISALFSLLSIHGSSSFLWQKSRTWTSTITKKLPINTIAGTFASGILSALLPCGVLIPLWALCAASGSPATSATMSLGFVIGTIPGSLFFKIAMQQKWWNKPSMNRNFRMAATITLLTLGISVIAYRGLFFPYINAASPTRADSVGTQCIQFSPVFD